MTFPTKVPRARGSKAAPVLVTRGSFTAKALVHRWRRIATSAGIQWSHNALRHSCLTFRTAILQNPAQVAFEAGNSAGMIYKHYKALRTEAQAREWFDVVPDTDAGTVLPMEAAPRVA